MIAALARAGGSARPRSAREPEPPAEAPSGGGSRLRPGFLFARSSRAPGRAPRAPPPSAARTRGSRSASAPPGCAIAHDRFRVPGHGRSRNVVGIYDTPADCLVVLIAHTDSVPPAPGADDNASGVGTLVALAPRLRTIEPACDIWLIASGAEERPYTGHADHLGARAAVPRVKRRAADLRFVLSLDEVGRGTTFHLRSPATRAARRGPDRQGRPRRRALGARLRHGQLRPPRVRARRAAGASSASPTTRSATPRPTRRHASSRARSSKSARSSSGS